MSVLRLFVGIQAGLLSYTSDVRWKQIIFLIGTGFFIVSVVFLIINLIKDSNFLSNWYILGMALGCIFSAIQFFKTKNYIEEEFQYMAWEKKLKGSEKFFDMLSIFDVIFAGTNVILNLGAMFGDWNENEIYNAGSALFSIITGSLSLKLARHSLIFLEDRYRDDKAKVAGIYGGASIIIAAILVSIVIWRIT
jgi:hypothetical protein